MIIVSQNKMIATPLDGSIQVKERNMHGSNEPPIYEVVIEKQLKFHVLGEYNTEKDAKTVLEFIVTASRNNCPVCRIPSIEELKKYKNKPEEI